MKKIVSLITLAALTVSLATPVLAEKAVVPQKVVVGEKSLVLVFEDNTTAGEVNTDDIVIKNSANENITFDAVITNNVVCITPSDTFATDESVYNIVCGSYDANFSLKKVWSAELDDSANVSDSFDTLMSNHANSKIEIADGKLHINEGKAAGGETVIFPNYEGQKNEENLTFNFNVTYTKPSSGSAKNPMVVSFNSQSNQHTSYTVSGGFYNTGALWVKSAASDYMYKGFIINSDDSTTGVNGGKNVAATSKTADTREKIEGTFPKVTDATTTYNISVAKSGDYGVLSLDGDVIDTYNTTDFINTLTKNKLSDDEIEFLKTKEMPKTGYFSITQMPYKNGACNYSDMSIVKYNVTRNTEGDILLSGNEPTGDGKSFSVEFNEDISAVDNAEEKVKVYIGKDEVECNFETKFKKLIITPQDGIKPNSEYRVEIDVGFGRGKLTAKEKLEAYYTLVYEQGNITIDKMNADLSHLYLTFNRDVSEIENLKDSLRVEFNGVNIPFDIETEKENVTLKLKKTIEIDQIYDLYIDSDMGFEFVRYSGDTHKYFKIKTIKEADFSKKDASAEEYLTHFQYSTETNPPASTMLFDSKYYMGKSAYATIHFNKMNIESMEEYIFSFDVQHYGNNGLVLLFNVNDPTGNPGNRIFEFQGGSPLTAFGWYTKDSNRQMRDYLIEGCKNSQTTDPVVHIAPKNPITEDISNENVSFEADKVVLPQTEAPVYHYTLDKKEKRELFT